MRRDPAVAATVVVLWLLLGLFILYPLGMMLVRVLSDEHGGYTLAELWTVLSARQNVRAFGNSLLLASLAGILGTLLGFVFAFTAARARLPGWLLTAIDAAVLMPLVSP